MIAGLARHEIVVKAIDSAGRKWKTASVPWPV